MLLNVDMFVYVLWIAHTYIGIFVYVVVLIFTYRSILQLRRGEAK